MINRRQLIQLLPLSLLLGGSFGRRSALARESPADVVTRLFRVAQEGDWARLVDAMSDDDLNRMRTSLEATAGVSGAESIGQMIDTVQTEPEPFGELRGLLDELTAMVEAEEEKQSTDEQEVQDDPVVLCRQVLDAAGLPRSRIQSDRDFLMAYLGRFEPFLKELGETELTIVGSIPAGEKRVHVAYRLAGVLSLRPSVMSLTYSEVGWCAAGGDQLPMVAMLAAAEQTMPTLQVRILGELSEAGLAHIVCEADCSTGEDCFHPAFCCTWYTDDAELPQMRASRYRALINRLRREIKASWKQAIKLASKTE